MWKERTCVRGEERSKRRGRERGEGGGRRVFIASDGVCQANRLVTIAANGESSAAVARQRW